MQFPNEKDKIIIIDFGSQVTKLIARRIRDLGVYSEIIPSSGLQKIKEYKSTPIKDADVVTIDNDMIDIDSD